MGTPSQALQKIYSTLGQFKILMPTLNPNQ